MRQPRVRDRETGAGDPERFRFTPTILPLYARRPALKELGMLIPILYLKGVSTGDFEEALVALLGKSKAAQKSWPDGDLWRDRSARSPR